MTSVASVAGGITCESRNSSEPPPIWATLYRPERGYGFCAPGNAGEITALQGTVTGLEARLTKLEARAETGKPSKGPAPGGKGPR